VAEGIQDNLQTGHIPGPPSPYTCPECGGALWELSEGRLLRFRCHVGHGFTADALAAEQIESVEQIMWGALRALEEQAALWRRMAQHAEDVRRGTTAREFEARAKDAERRANTLRRLLLDDEQTRPHILQTSTASNGKRTVRKRRSRAG
jgi:two-component system chemotaxis response regulator CheB